MRHLLALPLLVAAVLVASGCDMTDALEENPGREPEPKPTIQLSCGRWEPEHDFIGMPLERGTPASVARRFLSRHGLRDGDQIVRVPGAWEPARAAVVVMRGDRKVAAFELERENKSWIIRNLMLCPPLG